MFCPYCFKRSMDSMRLTKVFAICTTLLLIPCALALPTKTRRAPTSPKSPKVLSARPTGHATAVHIDSDRAT